MIQGVFMKRSKLVFILAILVTIVFISNMALLTACAGKGDEGAAE